MERASLPRDQGMLFVFDAPSRWSFWMKNTLVPLDLLFLDPSGVIVDIQTMLPEPGKPDAELSIYTARGTALYALEINAGLAQELGVSVGMRADLRLR